MKLAVLGGGGVRAPMLVAGLARAADRLSLEHVVLQDASEARLQAMAVLTRRIHARSGAPFRLALTTDAAAALDGADAVFMAIRVGTEDARVKDERIALDLGVIGQETTGPGGFAMALRTVPVAAGYARMAAERAAAHAVFLNFTNPVGIVTRAMAEAAPGLRVIGLCDTPSGLVAELAAALGTDPSAVRADYVGLNHLGWLDGLEKDGEDLLAQVLADGAALARQVPALALFPDGLLATLGLVPNEYCYHYYCPEASLAHLRAATELRSEQVRRLNRELLSALAGLAGRADGGEAAEALYRRVFGERHRTYMAMETGGAGRPADDANLLGGEGGYQRLAIATLAALRLPPDRPARLILDVPAGGALPGYDPADVVEIACAVSSAGVAPIRRGPVPPATAGLMAAVAAYERLTVAAAVRGDRDLAVLALMAHPLVRSYALAERLVDAYLDAHRAYLPQFA